MARCSSRFASGEPLLSEGSSVSVEGRRVRFPRTCSVPGPPELGPVPNWSGHQMMRFGPRVRSWSRPGFLGRVGRSARAVPGVAPLPDGPQDQGMDPTPPVPAADDGLVDCLFEVWLNPAPEIGPARPVVGVPLPEAPPKPHPKGRGVASEPFGFEDLDDRPSWEPWHEGPDPHPE